MVNQSQDSFYVGERVLCYEPDPTLIKKLYSAKIVNITFDPIKNGKKPRARYWIHFIGWKKTWDWQVDRELIMKDTPDNRNLKKRIDEKLHPFIQKKYHKKLVPTLALGQYPDHFSSIKTKEKDKISEPPHEIQDIGRTVPQSLKAPAASTIRIPQISFPSPLKKILDRDYDLVNNENKIPLLSATTTTLINPNSMAGDNTLSHHCPHFIVDPSGARELSPNSPPRLTLTPATNSPSGPTPHAVYILEAYLKTLYYSVKSRDFLGSRRGQSLKTTSTLAVQPGGIPSQDTHLRADTSHQTSPPHDTKFENNFEMCKEVMDGLRSYFDCLISLRLLYAGEKDLYSIYLSYPSFLPLSSQAANDNKASPPSRPSTTTREASIDNTDHPAIAKHRTPRNAALKAYSNLLINPPRYRHKVAKPLEHIATILEAPDNLSTDLNLSAAPIGEETPKLMSPLPIRFRLHQWWNHVIKSSLLRSPTHLPNPQLDPLAGQHSLKRPSPVTSNSPKRTINFRTHPDDKATLGDPPPSDYSIYLLLPVYLPSSTAVSQTFNFSQPQSNVQFTSPSNHRKDSLPWELVIPKSETFSSIHHQSYSPEPRGVKRLKKNREFARPSPKPQFVTPLAPSKIFGFIHLLRLLAILPDILNQHNVILLYPKVFSRQLENFLQYLSQNHQTYMQSCVYVSASLIKEELLRSQRHP